MHQVQIADLAWLTTFPHRVMPQDDEWLPSANSRKVIDNVV